MIRTLAQVTPILAVLGFSNAVPQGLPPSGTPPPLPDNGAGPESASSVPTVTTVTMSTISTSDTLAPSASSTSSSAGTNGTRAVSASSAGQTFTGKATYYGTGGKGACGWETSDNDFNGESLAARSLVQPHSVEVGS